MIAGHGSAVGVEFPKRFQEMLGVAVKGCIILIHFLYAAAIFFTTDEEQSCYNYCR